MSLSVPVSIITVSSGKVYPMTRAEDIWLQNSDDQVLTAAACLEAYPCPSRQRLISNADTQSRTPSTVPKTRRTLVRPPSDFIKAAQIPVA
jgi:hypothetical protein